MSRTCYGIRPLHLAALAGVCLMGTTALAQTKGVKGTTAPVAAKSGIAAKLAPRPVVQKSVLNHTAQVSTAVYDGASSGGGMAPRGVGGACVLPGGQGCVTVTNAEECTNQGGTYQGNGSACPVDLCSGLSSADCQNFEYPRVAGTSFASMGPGNTTLLMLADDFRTNGDAAHELTELCWWGAYTARTGVIDCANPAPEVDNFFVTIYAMTDGLPNVNTVVGARQQGVDMMVTRRAFCDGGNRATWEFHATFTTAISLEANTCYALEVRNPNNDTVNWFWSRSADVANGLSWQRNGEVAYSQAGVQGPPGGDRAFCMNVGLDVFQSVCALPPPPICENPDSNGYARLGANTGLFSADPSAPGVGLQLANSLQFATSDPITNVCFWGFWVAPDGTQPTGPDVPDFWFTIYDSNGPDGLPGTEILRGHTGTDAGFVTRRNGGNYNIAFPAFNPEPNHCYHFSISFPQDNADPAHAFRFAWGAALTAANPLSNFYTASRVANPVGTWAFQNFGDPTIAETSMVFDQPGVLPSCGAPPPPPPPPANDNCAAAETIAGTGTFDFDNRSATCEANEIVASCATSGASAWYAWTPACDGTYTVSMCAGSANDNVLSAYAGSCGSPVELACGDDTCNVGGGPSVISFAATGGTTYLLRVADWSAAECGTPTGSAGTFTIFRDEGECKGNPCPCDFNSDNILNSQDFFDFLTAFFANQPSADYNDDNVINSQDFFDFLTCFFTPPAGC
jgi:hypothetical protein